MSAKIFADPIHSFFHGPCGTIDNFVDGATYFFDRGIVGDRRQFNFDFDLRRRHFDFGRSDFYLHRWWIVFGWMARRRHWARKSVPRPRRLSPT